MDNFWPFFIDQKNTAICKKGEIIFILSHMHNDHLEGLKGCWEEMDPEYKLKTTNAAEIPKDMIAKYDPKK